MNPPSYLQRMRAEKARREALRAAGRHDEILQGRPKPVLHSPLPRFPDDEDRGFGAFGKRYHGD